MQSAFRISNGLAPKQGPKAMRLDLDFSTTLAVDIDFEKEQDASQLDFVQAMWVDAKDFPTRIDVNINGVPMLISIPAFSQGMFPVLNAGIFRATFTTSALSLIKPAFIFLNVPQPYFVYTPGL